MTRRDVLAVLLVVAAVAACSANSWSNGFVADDSRLIVHNTWLETGSLLDCFLRDYYASPDDTVRLGYYRPLTLAANRLDFALWGRRPAGWRLTNWLAHLGASLLVLALGRHLLGARTPAAIAALWFATTPLHAESVTFVSGRVDVLATLFGLGCVLAALAARPGTASLLWLAALLSKEVAAVVPALAAAALLAVDRRPWRRRLAAVGALAIPCALVFALYLPLRLQATGVLKPRTEASPVVLTAARALNIHAFYWSKLLLPGAGFDVEPPLPGGERFSPEGLALALLFPLLALALWRRGAGPLARGAAVGLLWVTIALLPVSQLARLETSVSPRFVYLASAGFALAAGAALAALGRMGVVLAVLVVAVNTALHLHHNGYYRDPVTFFTARKGVDPASEAVRVSLAGALAAAGERDRALAELEEASRRFPEDAELHALTGSLAHDLGRLDRAAEHLGQAAPAMPLRAGVLLELGGVELVRGEAARAASAFERAQLADPTSIDAVVGLAQASLAGARAGGDACGALAALARALAAAPGDERLRTPAAEEEALRALCAGAAGAAREPQE